MATRHRTLATRRCVASVDEASLRAKFEALKQEQINKFQGVNLYIKNLDESINDEKLKELTRGKRVDAEGMRTFVESLTIPDDAKKRLLSLTPGSYIGAAAKLAREV